MLLVYCHVFASMFMITKTSVVSVVDSEKLMNLTESNNIGENDSFERARIDNIELLQDSQQLTT